MHCKNQNILFHSKIYRNLFVIIIKTFFNLQSFVLVYLRGKQTKLWSEKQKHAACESAKDIAL